MICNEEGSTLTQWKRQFLENIGLSSPDGRPLYAYRLIHAPVRARPAVAEQSALEFVVSIHAPVRARPD